MKIGMRTVKTAIAVALTIFISQLLHLKSPIFAGIAAIITMQSSVTESFQVGKYRILGTVLGASVGLVASLIAPGNPLLIGIGIIIIIYLANLFSWKKAVSIACIVFLSIILSQEPGNRLSYSIYRTLDTFVGIIIAVLVNYFILPPNYEEKIESSCRKMLEESLKLVEDLVWSGKELLLDNIHESFIALDENYSILKEETDLNLCKKNKCTQLKEFFKSLEIIHYNLSVIANMDRIHTISNQNGQLLEMIYNKNLPLMENTHLGEEDIVFNYHLRIILEEFQHLTHIWSI